MELHSAVGDDLATLIPLLCLGIRRNPTRKYHPGWQLVECRSWRLVGDFLELECPKTFVSVLGSLRSRWTGHILSGSSAFCVSKSDLAGSSTRVSMSFHQLRVPSQTVIEPLALPVHQLQLHGEKLLVCASRLHCTCRGHSVRRPLYLVVSFLKFSTDKTSAWRCRTSSWVSAELYCVELGTCKTPFSSLLRQSLTSSLCVDFGSV